MCTTLDESETAASKLRVCVYWCGNGNGNVDVDVDAKANDAADGKRNGTATSRLVANSRAESDRTTATVRASYQDQDQRKRMAM